MQITYNHIPIKLKGSEITCMQKIKGKYKFERLKKEDILRGLMFAESIHKNHAKVGKRITCCLIIGKLTHLNLSISTSINVAKIYWKHVLKQWIDW